jgi:hypothetical protein
LIDARLDRNDLEVIGTAVSPAYRWYDAALSTYLWVMDVDLSTDGNRPDANTVVKSIPIADASHGVHKAGPSTKLRLRRRSLTQTYEIVGLASIVNGQVAVIEVTYGATVAVAATQTYGSEYRLLDYSDLGNHLVNGGYKYGTLPYGTIGKYNAQGVLQYPIVVP